MTQTDYKQVLDFWFSKNIRPKWFAKDSKFDQEIASKFQKLYQKISTENFDSHDKSPENILAKIIILDQFPRNIFRETPQAFANDNQALKLTKYAIKNYYDKKLNNEQKQFLYMPLMHSEDLANQELSVKLFAFNNHALNYAKAHYNIIKQFGRFPHRNNILGRVSSVEELEFLKQPNSSF